MIYIFLCWDFVIFDQSSKSMQILSVDELTAEVDIVISKVSLLFKYVKY